MESAIEAHKVESKQTKTTYKKWGGLNANQESTSCTPNWGTASVHTKSIGVHKLAHQVYLVHAMLYTKKAGVQGSTPKWLELLVCRASIPQMGWCAQSPYTNST